MLRPRHNNSWLMPLSVQAKSFITQWDSSEDQRPMEVDRVRLSPSLSVAPRPRRAQHCWELLQPEEKHKRKKGNAWHTRCLFADIRAARLRRSEGIQELLFLFRCWMQAGEPASAKEIPEGCLNGQLPGSRLLCFGWAVVTSIQKCLHLNWPCTRADQTANLKQVIISVSNPPRIFNHFLRQFLS